jgi:hypothetical protein
MNLLNLINPSLKIVYCSTTLSNHGIIRIVLMEMVINIKYHVTATSANLQGEIRENVIR